MRNADQEQLAALEPVPGSSRSWESSELRLSLPGLDAGFSSLMCCIEEARRSSFTISGPWRLHHRTSRRLESLALNGAKIPVLVVDAAEREDGDWCQLVVEVGDVGKVGVLLRPHM